MNTEWTGWCNLTLASKLFKICHVLIYEHTKGVLVQVTDRIIHINVPEHAKDWLVQVIDHINIPEQNNGLTGSSDGSRQHS
jgi:hypothetical protein